VGDIGVSLDGSTVFVTTNRTKADDDDLLTVSYSAAGAERWKATYDGGLTFDRARGLAVSPKGTKVFVAASVHGGATLAYKT
jgi:DNA-binding beta-propeller fold protein YncE